LARRAEALKAARALEREHELARFGVRPAPDGAAKHRARPFAEAVAEYLAWGRAQGGRNGRPWAIQHGRNRERLLRWWGARLSLETLGDLEGALPRVEAALRELQAAGRHGKTLQCYAESLSAFCAWAVERRYLREHPLRGLRRFDTTSSRIRRALTPHEIRALLSVAPPCRRILYEVAMVTGLRAGELRALRIADLDTERGGLRLSPEWTKNRRGGFQYLPPDLVRRLASYIESGETARQYRAAYERGLTASTQRRGRAQPPSMPPADALFFVPSHTARDLRKDLKAAGVPPWTAAGVVDFHSLRVTALTLAEQVGAGVKELQHLARHSTPALTLNRYVAARPERLAGIVAAVGKVVSPDEKCARSVHAAAVGAEGLDVSAVDGMRFGNVGMVRAGGLEPPTYGLKGRCSTD